MSFHLQTTTVVFVHILTKVLNVFANVNEAKHDINIIRFTLHSRYRMLYLYIRFVCFSLTVEYVPK